jgi:hypothetical protein
MTDRPRNHRQSIRWALALALIVALAFPIGTSLLPTAFGAGAVAAPAAQGEQRSHLGDGLQPVWAILPHH